MRISEKLALIDKIGRVLQSRFTTNEIDLFLAEFGVSPPQNVMVNSKWVYSKQALSGVSENTILRIAAELDMPVSAAGRAIMPPPRNWEGTKFFRLFISHISKNKVIATRLKECLAPLAISGFVAHEDIHPTLEWQSEIERALHTMDGFIAVHTTGFSGSYWTQQEVGFALGRGTKVISFKMGEDPTGFISKQQALPRRNRTAEAIAEEIDTLLSQDHRTSERLAEAKLSLLPRRSAFDADLDEDVPF